MFLSSATNTLDAKGRISVPAEFRAAVGDGNFDGIIVWPSFDGPYLEGGGISLLQDYQALLEGMDPYDDARIAFERAIFAACKRLSFDANGRVSLPSEFAEFANLSDQATFIGLGRRFEIWNPEKYQSQSADVRKTARENRHRLRPGTPLHRRGE
ncbi:MAG TPA: division/cell wall cluster transcriptional repressor MraZ [Hellea balneolensis]|uniref:Transcriptional regulator MraZ n=1 Tax=Hellea balneolensis TaxID=287478 RepID=A0A7C5QUM9_9PROT|nr:division/cell wall cluster transcriptional repressor MraZ [Hellea balneolensis]